MISDLDLLQDYARNDIEGSFTALVNRHLDLVYSAALRQVRSAQLAEEVAQSVFTDLARSAEKLMTDTVLTAWLYQVTRRTAIDVVRREARRQSREQIASEMNAMNTTADDWTRIEPLLDDAMAALDESDRTAVLLRYFESKSLREVGQTLGVSDDAAQKRVSRAVDRLREFFTKRDLKIATSGLVVLLSANAVQAAPVGLAATVSAAAAAVGTTVTTPAAATATKAIAMTTLQKTVITATIVVATGAAIYEAREASSLRGQVRTLQQQQAPLAGQVEQLTSDYEVAARQLAALRDENERLRNDHADLPRLHGEVTRLRAMEQQLVQLKTAVKDLDDPFTKSVLDFTARAAELNQHFEQAPQWKIPELAWLNESDWIEAGKVVQLGSESEVRQSMMMLRSRAKHNLYPLWQNALRLYLETNNGQLPANPLELQPYFEAPIDDAILQRYRMLRTGDIAESQNERWLIEEKLPVDEAYDTRMRMGIDTLEIAPVATNQ